MNIRLSIDRFEGRKKEIAVLLTDDGTQINFPKRLLPKGVKAGDILSFVIERDLEATRQVSDQTRGPGPIEEDRPRSMRSKPVRIFALLT